jgi:predicted dithiol-disulfide oxidoreductase (DUF899 family)
MQHQIVSRDEWLAARTKLLARGKGTAAAARSEMINGNLTDWVQHHNRYDDDSSSCCHSE